MPASGSALIRDDQPGAAFAAVYAKLGDEPALLAGRAVERVDVPAIGVVPGVILHQDFDTYLSFWHGGIIGE